MTETMIMTDVIDMMMIEETIGQHTAVDVTIKRTMTEIEIAMKTDTLIETADKRIIQKKTMEIIRVSTMTRMGGQAEAEGEVIGIEIAIRTETVAEDEVEIKTGIGMMTEIDTDLIITIDS